MKTLAMTLGAALVAACGGSSPSPEQPAALADDRLVPEERMPTPSPAAEAVLLADLQPAATEPTLTEITASATLANAKSGAEIGFVKFSRAADGTTITITGEFTGLRKNAQHAFYIHENGDCSKRGKNIGGHLDPTHAQHGPPASSERHAGDFGNLSTDDAGDAVFEMTTDSVTIEPGRADSVVGRSVVIHAKKDDKKGNGGAVLACGVVDLD